MQRPRPFRALPRFSSLDSPRSGSDPRCLFDARAGEDRKRRARRQKRCPNKERKRRSSEGAAALLRRRRRHCSHPRRRHGAGVQRFFARSTPRKTFQEASAGKRRGARARERVQVRRQMSKQGFFSCFFLFSSAAERVSSLCFFFFSSVSFRWPFPLFIFSV